MLDSERKQNSETDYGSATDAGWEKKASNVKHASKFILQIC